MHVILAIGTVTATSLTSATLTIQLDKKGATKNVYMLREVFTEVT